MPQRPDPFEPSIEVNLAWVEGMLRWMAVQYATPVPDDLASLEVAPNAPGIYGDRVGPWGDGVGWLEHWRSLGGLWVNLGLVAGEDGTTSIRYETQWRAGDSTERRYERLVWPQFNFFGPYKARSPSGPASVRAPLTWGAGLVDRTSMRRLGQAVALIAAVIWLVYLYARRIRQSI